jgi:entericidin B
MRKRFAMTLISLFTLTAAASALSACNTARGAGEDVSAAGHAVTGTSERVRGR